MKVDSVLSLIVAAKALSLAGAVVVTPGEYHIKSGQASSQIDDGNDAAEAPKGRPASFMGSHLVEHGTFGPHGPIAHAAAAQEINAIDAASLPEGVVAMQLDLYDRVFDDDVIEAWNLEGSKKGAEKGDRKQAKNGHQNEQFNVVHDMLNNRLTYYTVNMSIGTPPQYFLTQIDTGSSDLWVPSSSMMFDGFDSSKSSTFRFLNGPFEIQYVKDSARGYWGTDTVGFANVNVTNQQFGVASDAAGAEVGIFGIGLPGSESADKEYSNFPQSLVDQGIINRNVYSMYLNDLHSKQARILFGGADKAHYHKLATLPLQSNASFEIELSSIKVNNTVVNKQPLKVLLDSGTSLTYLPEAEVEAIANHYGAKFNPSLAMYIVDERDLEKRDRNGIDYKFGDADINIAHDELFWPLSWFTLQSSPYYVMTVLPSKYSMNLVILGDSFLRSAYVVYDLDRKQIQIGQNIVSGTSDIVAL